MNTNTLPAQEASVVREDAAAPKATTSPIQPNYPFPPSSPEFTHMLMRCFVRGRNKAIDQLEAEQAAAVTKP